MYLVDSLRLGCRRQNQKLAMEQNPHIASVEDYLAAGKQFIDQGQLDAAEKIYKQLLELDPQSVEAHLGIFQIYQSRSDMGPALDHLVSALELNPLLLKPEEHTNLGTQLFAVGRFEQALDCCLRCVSLSPDSLEAHLLMCESYLKIGQFNQAIRALQRAIAVDPSLGKMDNKHHFRSSIPHKIWKIENCILEIGDDYEVCPQIISKIPNIADEHYYLARGYAAQGELDKAVHHYSEAIKARADFAEAHFNLGSVLFAWRRGADRVEFLAQAHAAFDEAARLKPDWAEAHLNRAIVGRQLDQPIDPLTALDMALKINPEMPEAHLQKGMFFYCHGKVEQSYQCFTTYLDCLEKKNDASPLSALGLRFLSDDAVTAIGHMSQTPDYLLKSQLLGLRPDYKTILLAPRCMTANPALLDLWARHICVVTDPATIRQLRPLYKQLSIPAWLGRMPDGSAATTQLAISYVQQEWDRQGRGPILSLTQQEIDRGWEVLQKLGVPRGAWFVAMHVREAGYKPEAKGSLFDRMRNVDPLNYVKAAREIVARGGWVIRLGEPTMTRLPAMPQLVDYAHSEFKSDWMDVFLASQCRFFLGGSGGVIALPQAFHVPVIASDFPPAFINLANAWDIFAPKLFWSRLENRLLSFKEIASPPFCYNEWHDVFEENGIDFVNNTEDEILEMTLELIERMQGSAVYTAEDEALQEKYRKLYPPSLGAKLSRVGRHFLRTHADLLE